MAGTGSRTFRRTDRTAPARAWSAGLFATLLLTGCGTGQRAQTASEIPVVDGISAQSGSLAIRDAGISSPSDSGNYASGSSAPLQLVIVNSGRTSDRLVSVTSSAATAVSLTPGDGSGASSSGAAGPTSTAGSSPDPGTGSSTTVTLSQSSPAGPASGDPAAVASAPIPLPAGQAVRIGYPGAANSPAVLLTGLKADLYPAQSVPVVFTFASGAVLTASLGVKLTAGGNSAAPTVAAPSAAG